MHCARARGDSRQENASHLTWIRIRRRRKGTMIILDEDEDEEDDARPPFRTHKNQSGRSAFTERLASEVRHVIQDTEQ
jgi:hypothetical protein